jgi:cation-transporting ATPase 13A3/4/5
MGYRYLPDYNRNSSLDLRREEVEKDLTFLGLLIMVNELKPATTPAIQELKEGKVHSSDTLGGVLPIMATGDNILTAINKSMR